jgi:hypothetical protein
MDHHDYFVFRCEDEAACGRVEYFSYFMPPAGDEPTLEYVRWTPLAALDPETVDSLFAATTDTLTRIYGPPFERSGGSAPWLKFRWPPGGELKICKTALRAPALEITLQTVPLATLLHEEAELWVGEGRGEWVENDYLLHREIAAALRPRWPEFAAAMEAPYWPPLGAAPAVRAALADVKGERGEQHDLVFFAADVWAADQSRHHGPDVLQPIESTAPLGFHLVPRPVWTTDERTSLLDSLVARASENRWTDEAFLVKQVRGWDTCDDPFRLVIERGDAFLREHPDSRLRNEIAMTVAQAHETAWSLAMARCPRPDCDWDWEDYVLDAPPHREAAIALYERVLREHEGPETMAISGLKRRLPRLRLDVDTNFHRYHCEDATGFDVSE